jgi:hypothetical protein
VDDDVADRPDPPTARLLEAGEDRTAEVTEQGSGRELAVPLGDPVRHRLEVEAVGRELGAEALGVIARRHGEVGDDVPDGPSLAERWLRPARLVEGSQGGGQVGQLGREERLECAHDSSWVSRTWLPDGSRNPASMP